MTGNTLSLARSKAAGPALASSSPSSSQHSTRVREFFVPSPAAKYSANRTGATNLQALRSSSRYFARIRSCENRSICFMCPPMCMHYVLHHRPKFPAGTAHHIGIADCLIMLVSWSSEDVWPAADIWPASSPMIAKYKQVGVMALLDKRPENQRQYISQISP